MQEAVGTSDRMPPYWVQWLFAAGGITPVLAVFLTLWAKLVNIEKRIVALEENERPPASPAAAP